MSLSNDLASFPTSIKEEENKKEENSGDYGGNYDDHDGDYDDHVRNDHDGNVDDLDGIDDDQDRNDNDHDGIYGSSSADDMTSSEVASSHFLLAGERGEGGREAQISQLTANPHFKPSHISSSRSAQIISCVFTCF